MTAYTERAIIVVPALRRAAMRTVVKILDPNGDGAFDAELSATGNAPVTHYWCSWQMTPAERARMETEIATLLSLGVQIFWLNHWDSRQARPTSQEVLALVGLRSVVRPLTQTVAAPSRLRRIINRITSLFRRNKVILDGSTMTVFQEDDSTSAWTASVSTTADTAHINAIDPID
jgi:hypothetical protein